MSEMTLEERVAALEEKLSDTSNESYGRRLHKFKEEIKTDMREYREDIKGMLAKFHDERQAVDSGLTQPVVDALANAQAYTGMVHKGLNRAEARLNQIWNTFNALVRACEVAFVNLGEFEDREAFEKAFIEAGRIVFQESMAREKATFAKLKEMKASGRKLTPVKPDPESLTPADRALQAIVGMVQEGLEENREMFKESAELQMEAAATQAAEEAKSNAQVPKETLIVKP